MTTGIGAGVPRRGVTMRVASRMGTFVSAALPAEDRRPPLGLMGSSARHARLLPAAIVVALMALIACSPSVPPPTAAPQGLTGPQPPPQQIVVSAAHLRDVGSSGAIAGMPATVTAHALAERGVAGLELWDSGELIAVQDANLESPSPAFYASWPWVPATAGDHTLVVRAVDMAGGVVQSNAVRVSVAESLAEPSAGLVNAVASVSMNLDAASKVAPLDAPYGLSVPAVQATLSGCTLQLAFTNVADTATGIQIVGLAPATSQFMPLASFERAESDEARSIELTGQGDFLFSATSFDDSVQAISPPVAVTAPTECERSQWTGELSLANGRLTTSQPVESAYIYVSQGEGASVRVPAVQGEFVTPAADGAFDFGPLLPAIDASTFEFEAWGWQSGALVRLGSGTYTPPAAAPGGQLTFGGGPPQLSGATLTSLSVLEGHWGPSVAGSDCQGEFCFIEEPLQTGIIERPELNSTGPITKKFRWQTSLDNVSQLVWQILPYPPANTGDLTPPFLIDDEVIAVSPGQTEGEFTVDFNEYFQSSVPTLELSSGSEEVTVGPIFPGIGTSTPAPGPTPTGSGGQVISDALKLAAFSGTFYVRLVPIVLNSTLPPSNAVAINVVEPSEEIVVPTPTGQGWNQNAYTVQWTYVPPKGADSKYSRCAIVVAIDPAKKVDGFESSYEFYEQRLASGQPICYKPPSDSGWSPLDVFDAFVEYVSDVWNFVSDGIKEIKAKIVQAVLVAVPCTEIASQAACEAIANTAIDVALIAAGVPPTLPDFDSVMAGLKGDLATAIVASAGSIPGVSTACGLAEGGAVVSDKVKTCEELAEYAIDEIIEEVEEARSAAAGKAAGVWLPGVTFAPDPRGIFEGPTFDLKITRTSDPVLPSTCSLSVYMKSLKKGWTFPEQWEGKPKEVTADVAGEPMLGASMVIPPLAPGESINRRLFLTKPRKWFESPRAEMYWHYYENMGSVANFTRAWALLTFGAELTFGVNSNCAPPSQQGPHVLTQDSIFSSN